MRKDDRRDDAVVSRRRFEAQIGERELAERGASHQLHVALELGPQQAEGPLDTGLAGLYLVGDAVKPAGYLMVEGVAQSVNALLDVLDRLEPGATVAPAPHTHHPERSPHKPPRRRALHWLIAPPPVTTGAGALPSMDVSVQA